MFCFILKSLFVCSPCPPLRLFRTKKKVFELANGIGYCTRFQPIICRSNTHVVRAAIIRNDIYIYTHDVMTFNQFSQTQQPI